MHEIVINLHMHTPYSDGFSRHADIAKEALRAGLDAVIVTDHNVYVEGVEDYYSEGDRRVLLLVGEEVHDQARQPQKNHLLVFGANKEMATLAWDVQRLLNAVRQAGGLAFLAHPKDPHAPAFGEDDLSWEDWEVQGYTGIELWNGMSEFKGHLKSYLHGFYYAFNPERIAVAPFPEVLVKWDALLESGQKVVAIGGSDAHALPVKLGPLKRVLFPYEFHFRCINTHLLLERPLSGELEEDRAAILDALRLGRAFVGYDLPASTRGFRFSANGIEKNAQMGEEINAAKGVTLQVRLPQKAFCRLVRHGQVVEEWRNQATCSHITSQPGAYRVEAYIPYKGKLRGWIFSNPIYVKK